MIAPLSELTVASQGWSWILGLHAQRLLGTIFDCSAILVMTGDCNLGLILLLMKLMFSSTYRHLDSAMFERLECQRIKKYAKEEKGV